MKNLITTLVLTLFFTGCGNSPKILYSPNPAKELTQVKILPGYGQRTWSSVCLNKEWQGLHEQPLSNNILGFDSSNFSRTIKEVIAELPVNEPTIFSYNFSWSTGSGSNAGVGRCSSAHIIELKPNHMYKFSGSLVKHRECKFKLIEIDSEGIEKPVPLIRNFIPCDKHIPSNRTYEINKLYAIQQMKSKSEK